MLACAAAEDAASTNHSGVQRTWSLDRSGSRRWVATRQLVDAIRQPGARPARATADRGQSDACFGTGELRSGEGAQRSSARRIVSYAGGQRRCIARSRFGARSADGPTTPRYYDDDILGGSASYELDLWGRIRNEVVAGNANAAASAADLENARLSLIAQLVDDYVQLRSLDRESAILDDTVGAYARAAAITGHVTAPASPPGSTWRRPRRSSMPRVLRRRTCCRSGH